jgi:hypothetical protein
MMRRVVGVSPVVAHVSARFTRFGASAGSAPMPVIQEYKVTSNGMGDII